MKRVATASLVLIALAAAPAFAGEIFGKVTLGSASVGDAATIVVRCGDQESAANPTDKTGGYHVIAARSGKCALTVTFKGQSASVEVVSYEDPVQCDVLLEMKDGKLQARRR